MWESRVIRVMPHGSSGSVPHLGRDCSAGELTHDEIERLVAVVQNPLQFKIPKWMLNRRKDWKDGKDSQVRSAASCPLRHSMCLPIPLSRPHPNASATHIHARTHAHNPLRSVR